MSDYRRRWGALVAATVVLAALLAACGGGGSSSSSTEEAGSETGGSETTASAGGSEGEICAPEATIGVSYLYASAPIIERGTEALEASNELLKFNIESNDANGDAAKQETAINAMVTKGVDAIIADSAVASAERGALENAKAAGIPVIETSSGGEESPLFTAQYNENEEEMGNIMAKHIAETVPNAKIGNLSTALTPAGTIRNEALKAVFSGPEANGGEIVQETEIQPTEQTTGTTRAVEGQLAAHPDINVIYAVFDTMVGSAIQAVKAKGSDAKVYSYFLGAVTTPELENPSSPLQAVAEANLPLGYIVAMDQIANEVAGNGKIDPNALEEVGLEYAIVENGKLPPGNEVFPIEESLAPFQAKWEKEYPC